jgi:HAD superfamily hydrolase (TIGR01509 family)
MADALARAPPGRVFDCRARLVRPAAKCSAASGKGSDRPHMRPQAAAGDGQPLGRRRPVLYFDVMDTLVVDPFTTAMPAFFKLSFQELLAQKHPTSWLEFELGLLSEDQFLEAFFSDGRPVDGPGLRAAMRDSYRWVPGMEALVRNLHAAGHELHLFSNYPSWHTIVEEKVELSRYLQWTAVSCMPHIRARKPAPDAYAAAAAAVGVAGSDASALILIDDRKQNVQAAVDCGWDGIVFTTADALVDALRARGIGGV